MADTAPTTKLTFEGAQKLLAAAIAKARELKVPQCICIVDSGGHLLTMGRMDGAFALSIETALRKAQTAAAYGKPTGDIAAGLDLKLAIATEGKRVNLLPTVVRSDNDLRRVEQDFWQISPRARVRKVTKRLR